MIPPDRNNITRNIRAIKIPEIKPAAAPLFPDLVTTPATIPPTMYGIISRIITSRGNEKPVKLKISPKSRKEGADSKVKTDAAKSIDVKLPVTMFNRFNMGDNKTFKIG